MFVKNIFPDLKPKRVHRFAAFLCNHFQVYTKSNKEQKLLGFLQWQKLVSTSEFSCPLDFWPKNEIKGVPQCQFLPPSPPPVHLNHIFWYHKFFFWFKIDWELPPHNIAWEIRKMKLSWDDNIALKVFVVTQHLTLTSTVKHAFFIVEIG